MTCWFFSSYARVDDEHRDEKYVRTFYNVIKSEIAARVIDHSGSLGYLDQVNLQLGNP